MQQPHAATGVAALVVASPGHDFAFLKALFTGCGWYMDAVSSVKEGIRRIQNDSPRLMICDDRLEDGDWRVILDATMKRGYPPHLIVTSRLADERLWAEALNLGCYDVLVKPYDTSEVIRVVSTAWWGRSLGREAISLDAVGSAR